METGLKHVSTVTVSAANTALTMGSGDMARAIWKCSPHRPWLP